MGPSGVHYWHPDCETTRWIANGKPSFGSVAVKCTCPPRDNLQRDRHEVVVRDKMSTLIGRIDGQHSNESGKVEVRSGNTGVEVIVVSGQIQDAIDPVTTRGIIRDPERARALAALLEVAADTVERMRYKK